jgi:hypothetical protein
VLAAQSSVLGVEQLILLVGDFERAHKERLCDFHSMHRLLVKITLGEQVEAAAAVPAFDFRQHLRNQSFQLAHLKLARLNPHEFHADRVGEFFFFRHVRSIRGCDCQ